MYCIDFVHYNIFKCLSHYSTRGTQTKKNESFLNDLWSIYFVQSSLLSWNFCIFCAFYSFEKWTFFIFILFSLLTNVENVEPSFSLSLSLRINNMCFLPKIVIRKNIYLHIFSLRRFERFTYSCVSPPPHFYDDSKQYSVFKKCLVNLDLKLIKF